MEHVFIARQPILDRNGKLYAYELLHRRGNHDRAMDGDGDRMSSDVLLDALLDVRARKMNSTCAVFINVTRNILLHGGLDSFPSERVVLEVLETASVDRVLLDRLQALRSLGFTIALDDFVYSPDRAGLIDHADIVKLDVLALDDASLERHVEILQLRDVRLLAEKVESQTMHARALGLGFELFQGYFFARPKIFKSRAIRPNHLVLVQLLARIHDPQISPAELSGIIRGDVSMAVTVLRWANSPLCGLLSAIESVERAVVVLGLYTIRNWVSLLALARMEGDITELQTTILVRARACELFAAAMKIPNAESYFTVGLLSALDLILQVDMQYALDSVSLAPDQQAALLDRSGLMGAALNCVSALESGDERVARFGALTNADISRCYFEAIDWVNSLGSEPVGNANDSAGEQLQNRRRHPRSARRP